MAEQALRTTGVHEDHSLIGMEATDADPFLQTRIHSHISCIGHIDPSRRAATAVDRASTAEEQVMHPIVRLKGVWDLVRAQ